MGAYVPFFPTWLAARGIDGVAMGVVTATLPFMSVLGPPIFGALADAFGLRGSLLRVACFGALLAFGAIGVAGAFGVTLPFWALFAAVLAFALFRSPMFLLADVLASESAKRGGPSYPSMRLWGSLGFLILAASAGHFLDPKALAPLPLVIALALFVALASAFALPPKSEAPPRPLPGLVKELLSHAQMRWFLLTSMIGWLAHSSHELCLSLQLQALGASAELTGATWAIGVLSEVVLMANAAFIFRRASPVTCLLIAQITAVCRWILIASITNPYALLAIQPLHALSFGLMWIASQAYVRSRVDDPGLATAQGLFNAALAVGSTIGMPLWGWVFRAYAGRTTFVCAAIAASFGVVSALTLGRAVRSARSKEIALDGGAR
jgi:PPP family 3-phenylpropionic acid transporter